MYCTRQEFLSICFLNMGYFKNVECSLEIGCDIIFMQTMKTPLFKAQTLLTWEQAPTPESLCWSGWLLPVERNIKTSVHARRAITSSNFRLVGVAEAVPEQS